ncbi:hypothetical protein ACLQ2Q_19525 [Microbacterium sp. DT81.1]|uniref:family 43 glycosylhydrolase n=1 Tax=Microbacterium sp. DT81.1 TaxID=3393413 RepID=UPI003CED070A
MTDRRVAPGEVYRDPVYDGATDPTVVRDVDGGWWMFYTQRRATHPDPGPGVAWVHGSRIGVARGEDGYSWSYAGTLEPDTLEPGDAGLSLRAGALPAEIAETHWAPDVVRDDTVAGDRPRWRMYLTQIDGIPDRWDGHDRRIIEYVSDDLTRWERRGALELGSDRVIDAAVARCPDGSWRLWFKDEAAASVTRVAVSPDLDSWRLEGTAIGGRPHEGPYVFALGGWWWMITDEWRGMAVHRSSDAVEWVRQGGPENVILGDSGPPERGIQIGRHGSVVVTEDDARLYYFTHPWWDGSELGTSEDADSRLSAVHVARLSVCDGTLLCAR